MWFHFDCLKFNAQVNSSTFQSVEHDVKRIAYIHNCTVHKYNSTIPRCIDRLFHLKYTFDKWHMSSINACCAHFFYFGECTLHPYRILNVKLMI